MKPKTVTIPSGKYRNVKEAAVLYHEISGEQPTLCWIAFPQEGLSFPLDKNGAKEMIRQLGIAYRKMKYNPNSKGTVIHG